jgi:hypothetical protein
MMTISIEERRAIDEMDAEALQSFKDAVAKVYAELERTGETFPYLLDGKVVHITVAQLRALQQQAATAQENPTRLETR